METLISIINSFFIVMLFPACFALLYSPMIFDAPGSQKKIGLILVGIIIILFPLVIVMSEIFSWTYYAYNNLQTALLFACIPLIWIGLLIVPNLFYWLFLRERRK